MSFEHRFCTVFEQEKQLEFADNDFPIVPEWWDCYFSDGNIVDVFGNKKTYIRSLLKHTKCRKWQEQKYC